jgi:hypothetical protein
MPIQDLPPPPKKPMLNFGHSKPVDTVDYSGMSDDINTLSRRLRLLEESTTNLRKFFQVTEENTINRNKHYSAEFKTINSDILELRKEMQDIRDKMLLVIKELQSVARKEEVKVLEKYINLWNPIRFVTSNEVEQIVDDAIKNKSKKELKADAKL